MQTEKVRYELKDNLAVITLDDGKANALSHEVIDAINACLDRAEGEAAAVLIIGRPGRLSAGFELKTMTSGPGEAQELVTAGAKLLVRMYLFPRPIVVACSGHALAAGALMLLAADYRIGVEGDFKIGLNEVSIHLTLPIFAVELARDRLSKRHFTQAATQARIYDPVTAKDAGYLDAIEKPERLLDVAVEHARRLAALPAPAFGNTKLNERGATVKLIRDTLVEDMAKLMPPKVPG
jgi:enoyl-CoA hydratase